MSAKGVEVLMIKFPGAELAPGKDTVPVCLAENQHGVFGGGGDGAVSIVIAESSKAKLAVIQPEEAFKSLPPGKLDANRSRPKNEAHRPSQLSN